MRIAFIGGGNMASALIGGLIHRGVPAADLTVAEINPTSRERLTTRFGIECHADTLSAAKNADVVVLAVKPQQMREVLATLSPIEGQPLFISIAAGIRCADIARWLGGYPAIVRVMPNTPALVGRGMSGMFATTAVSAAQRSDAATILGAVGEILWVEREEQLDAVTAISGSGPAYVFYFIEALEEAAVDLGFSVADAKKLAMTTFAGAIELAGRSDESPAQLRANVTSKGGTTERALASLEHAQLKVLVAEAVRAAEARSRELGDELGRA